MATKAEQARAQAVRKGPNPDRVRKLEQQKDAHTHHDRHDDANNTTYTHPEWKRFRERLHEPRGMAGRQAGSSNTS